MNSNPQSAIRNPQLPKGSALGTAVRTLTVLPWPGAEAERFASTLPWFPLVGLALGSAAAGLAWLIGGCLNWSAAAGVLAVSLLALLTGGLHLDGLADTADGLGGGRTPDRSLEIMKDPRVGAMGVATVALVLMLKAVALARLAGFDAWLLIPVPVILARLVQVQLAVTLTYARTGGGTARSFVQDARPVHYAAAAAAAAVLSGLLAGAAGLAATIAAAGLGALLGRRLKRRLGGVTGDALGWASEIAETTMFFVLALACGCSPSKPPPASPVRDTVRVVSLAPSLTEIVCAVGGADCLVGRTSACTQPPDVVRGVPVAGDFGVPTLEVLAQLRPDWVIAVAFDDRQMTAAIERLGLRCRLIPCRTLDEIPRAMEDVGSLLRREEPARRAAAAVRAQLDELSRSVPREPHPLVFVEIWGDPLITAGRPSFLSELVGLAGGRNVADDTENDYFQISPEVVVARDPGVILMFDARDNASALRRAEGRPGWAGLRAVREGRVYGGFDADLVQRPGPRVAEAVRALRRPLHPEAS